jgi:hypothetical protein
MQLRWTWLASALLCACMSVETRPLSSVPDPIARLARPGRAWAVYSSDVLVGRVILFEEHGLARDSLYVVRNLWDQDLGIIDGLGRAYRYVPHEAEPAWVGSGTIAAGAGAILGSSPDCFLVEQSGHLLDARTSPDETEVQARSRPASTPPHGGGLPQSW